MFTLKDQNILFSMLRAAHGSILYFYGPDGRKKTQNCQFLSLSYILRNQSDDYDSCLALWHRSHSSKKIKDRLNTVFSMIRLMVLIEIGTESVNCHSIRSRRMFKKNLTKTMVCKEII